MNKQIKIELSFIDRITQKAKKTNRTCLENNCPDNAINSHILQKNGILNTITANGHLYMLKVSMMEAQGKFHKIGINNIFTFKGFCNKHDTLLFDYIENNIFDINQYKTKILFCYRAVLNELRKKQINVDQYNLIKQTPALNNLARRMNIDNLISNEKLGENDLFRLSNLIRSDIDQGVENFHFVTYTIPKIEVCASATFNTEVRSDMMAKRLSGRWSDPLNSLIINIMPYGDMTVITLGCHNSIVASCSYFFLELAKDPKKFISDVFIKNIETWVCSPDFYFRHIRQREKEIIKQFSLYPQERDYTYPTRIYLFG